MKKFVLLLALPLVLMASGLAQAAIPSFQSTAQYKALSSYVTYLKGLENTPATTEQKNTYTAGLTLRVDNANTRVAQLNTRRLTKAENDYSRQKEKILSSAKATAKKQKKQALATYKSYSEEERAAYQAEVTRIQLTYDDDIARANKTLKKLNRQLAKTENLGEITRLEKKINQVENKIAAYKKQRILEKNAAQRSYKKACADELAAYKRRLDRISQRFQANLSKRKAQAKRTYNNRRAQIKTTNGKEKEIVSNLNTNGQLYISNMPSS